MTDHGAAGFCTDHRQPADRPATVAEAVEVGARALSERAITDEDRLEAQMDVTDAEWDEAICVSHFINGEALCIDGRPETLTAAVLEAVGYADLLAEVENLHITVREDKRVVDRDAADVARLRAHILDIDAHATPYGDLPDDPGYVGTYLLTCGALHRALGTIGYSAPSCTAEAERDAARAALDRVRALPTWDTSSGGTKVVWASDIRVALDPEEPR